MTFLLIAAGGLAWMLLRERRRRETVEARLMIELESLRALTVECRADLRRLERRVNHPERAAILVEPPETDDEPPETDDEPPEEASPETSPANETSETAPEQETEPESVRVAASKADEARPQEAAFVDGGPWLKELLFGGNTVVRVGIVVLLVGVTLLLKYAADHALLPVEFRMAGAACGGLALVLAGLYLRHRRRGFAETLQGGGIATMYLVVFFSFRVYRLLPAELAFGLLAAIAALSAVLAVVQNAMALLVIGQAGGFLAPILASTGRGDHVALFGYYVVLNVAVASVAWFRAWRPLNLLGFAFTFGIGATWGVFGYEAHKFTSTEPFLIGFFLLYVLIPVLFALRASVRGWVDGSLVFGAPLAFLALQLALVRNIPFGMAYSTVGLSALYLGLAQALRRPMFVGLGLMRSSFLALGVGFGTLAIPYAFDSSSMSAASWAVEGAGLYFLGVRQARPLSRIAGVFLQVLAGAAILLHLSAPIPNGAYPFLHGQFLATVFLAGGSLFIAAIAHRHRGTLSARESTTLQLLIAIALLFLLPIVDAEVRRVVVDWWLPGARIGVLGALGLALEVAGRRAQWPWVRYAPATLVLLLAPLLLLWHFDLQAHLLSRGGAIGWPVYFGSLFFSLRHFVPRVRDHLGALYPMALGGLTLFATLLAAGVCAGPLQLGASFSSAAFGLGLALVLLASSDSRAPTLWPLTEEPQLCLGVGRWVLGLGTLLWTLWVVFSVSGRDEMLGYLPVFNPIELAQLIALFSVAAWHRSETRRPFLSELRRAVLPPLALAVLFVCWNGLMCRTAHRYFDVPWDFDALWDFGPLQVAVSISWAMIGLCVTVLASRTARRLLWIAGASLLGVVVVKLFTIDLARLPTLGKIGTFLVVGLLLLLVGYFSPVPPAQPEPEEQGA